MEQHDVRGEEQRAPVGGGPPPVRRPPTTPGPAWAGALAREEPWGAWLWVPQGGLVAVELRWSHGAGPTVLLATPDEQWWAPQPQPAPPLHRAWVQVPAGWTWIAIVQSYDDEVEVELATHLPVVDAVEAV